MMRRSLFGLGLLMVVCGVAMAEEFRGTITKIDGDTITVQPFNFGGFGGGKGKGKGKGDGEAKTEPKTFTIGSDVKVVRVSGKDKEETKLTLDELKTAIKVTGAVMATVTHEGDKGTEIKIGGGFGRGGFGGGKKKEDK